MTGTRGEGWTGGSGFGGNHYISRNISREATNIFSIKSRSDLQRHSTTTNTIRSKTKKRQRFTLRRCQPSHNRKFFLWCRITSTMSYCFCVKGAFLSTPKTGSVAHTLQLCDNELQVILKTTISLTFCSLSTFYNNTNDGETKAKKI